MKLWHMNKKCWVNPSAHSHLEGPRNDKHILQDHNWKDIGLAEAFASGPVAFVTHTHSPPPLLGHLNS